ncbi:MAG: hypothetical protein FWH05_04570 [Oscillospiraceae bacterium]|nr:hypothetical protein [Oscillospiraceae bacterium]
MKTNKRILLISLILLSAIFILVRYLQCLYSIDFDTGFYYGDGGLLGAAVYILILVVLSFFWILALVLKKNKTYFFTKRMKKITPFETTMLSLFMLASGAVYTHKAIVCYLERFDAFELTFLSIGAVGFFAIGAMLPIIRRITPAIGFAMALPATMYILRAVNIFMHNLVIINVSDKLITLLIDLALGVIYFALGRVFSRNETNFSRVKICGLGLFALVLIIGDAGGKVLFWLAEAETLARSLAVMQITMPTPAFMMDGATLAAVLYLLGKKGESKS